MTDEQINEIASSYMEMNADMYVSFLPSNLDKFARAVEQASRRAALEECQAALMEEMKEDGAIEWKWAANVVRRIANGDK